jgi:hypothetical protein
MRMMKADLKTLKEVKNSLTQYRWQFIPMHYKILSSNPAIPVLVPFCLAILIWLVGPKEQQISRGNRKLTQMSTSFTPKSPILVDS